MTHTFAPDRPGSYPIGHRKLGANGLREHGSKPKKSTRLGTWCGPGDSTPRPPSVNAECRDLETTRRSLVTQSPPRLGTRDKPALCRVFRGDNRNWETQVSRSLYTVQVSQTKHHFNSVSPAADFVSGSNCPMGPFYPSPAALAACQCPKTKLPPPYPSGMFDWQAICRRHITATSVVSRLEPTDKAG